VESGFLEPLLEYMNNHSNIGAVQPLICFEYDRNIIWNGGSFFNKFWGYFYTNGFLKKVNSVNLHSKKVEWITGCAFLIRNSALKKTGLFEEDLFAYYEDADLSFRLRNFGYDLQFIPESIVYHIAGMSGKSLTKAKEGFLYANVHYYNIRNRIWFLKRHVRFWQWPTVFMYHIFYFSGRLVYFLIRGRWEKLGACLKGIKDGIKM
jgi:GT2 family glycosyltransferase